MVEPQLIDLLGYSRKRLLPTRILPLNRSTLVGAERVRKSIAERMAHKSQKLQFEIVAVLGLLALFTHVHMFWIAGLFLAMIDIPDFGTPLRSIAESVEKIAGGTPVVVVDDQPVAVEDRPAALALEKPETRASKAKVHGHA